MRRGPPGLGRQLPQLDWAQRGFSFQQDGPLDMRQDQRQPLTAAEYLKTVDEHELARVLFELGGERQSRRWAREICRARTREPFLTTRQLAAFIERLSPRRGAPTHPATKAFQALRMEINDELGSLRRGLEASVRVLKPGGRLAVITFHSLEVRAVKSYGDQLARGYTFEGPRDVPELRQPCPAPLKWIQRHGLAPEPAEMEANPRSRSAQLRVLEKMP